MQNKMHKRDPQPPIWSHWILVLIGATGILFPFETAWGDSIASGNGRSCFISASASEFAGIGLLFGLCLVGLVIGLRLLLNGSTEKESIEKVQ